MKNYKQMSVGQIVADRFENASVFKKYGIDFCCGGEISFIRACEKANVSTDKLIEEMEQTSSSASESIDFKSWPLDLLVDYVLKIHHRGIREKGPQIMELLNKVAQVHGDNHPELLEVKTHFYESLVDLGQHLEKEEQVLFPYIYEMAEAQLNNKPVEEFHCGSVQYPISAMMGEHDAEGERYRLISELTNGYTAPADACGSYRLVLNMLQEFEYNLHTHIHVENNIIFPRAIELEKGF